MSIGANRPHPWEPTGNDSVCPDCGTPATMDDVVGADPFVSIGTTPELPGSSSTVARAKNDGSGPLQRNPPNSLGPIKEPGHRRGIGDSEDSVIET